MRAQESSVVFGRKGPLLRRMAAYKGTGSGQYVTAMLRTDQLLAYPEKCGLSAFFHLSSSFS